MKKKALIFSIILLGVLAIFFINTITIDASVFPGHWLRTQSGKKVGCLAPGEECGIVKLPPDERQERKYHKLKLSQNAFVELLYGDDTHLS